MKSRIIKVGELLDFVQTDEYQGYQIIPISHHRALSHVNNPRAAAEDVALIIYFADKQPVAYLGILPDYIYSEQQATKVGILSGLFVAPTHRGKGLAKHMVELAILHYPKILGFDSSPEAFALYKSMSSVQTGYIEGRRFFFKVATHKWLTQRFTFLQPFTSLFRYLDAVINKSFKQPKQILSKEAIILQKIDAVSQIDFKKYNRSKEFFQRDEQAFSWIADFPWILPRQDKLENYYFSAYDEHFISSWYRVNIGQKEIAHVHITVRKEVMKINYIFSETERWTEISAAILMLIEKYRPTTLVTFYPRINQILEQNKQTYAFKKTTLRTVMSVGFENLAHHLNGYIIHCGDADGIFT